ncbi:PEGA domain-containing protein [Prevotella sp. 10(H)]|uniref:PEGA domain-containing protein n=1 Tax=Prevotella sp. 10(H) TaxID=1158294 RepID=UPI0004A73CE2|nr:PEGA domain-containing protein [Prevotella sp. 10(H)]
MKKILYVAFTIILCSALTGCSSYAFFVDSNPPGADLTIENSYGEVLYTVKTPAKVESKYMPEGDYTIFLTKDGYEKTRVLKGNESTLKLKKMNLGTRALKKAE